jgi:hypothetical protein
MSKLGFRAAFMTVKSIRTGMGSAGFSLYLRPYSIVA